jgi:MraZ protein
VGETVFRGTAYLSLDAKGRLAIPAKQRERLLTVGDSSLILTVDRARCLLLFPAPTWQVVERDLADLPAFDDAAIAVRRLYLGSAEDVEMDTQGRILLPSHLREFAGLDKRVALVGQGLKFEIWDEQKWKDRTNADLDNQKISEMAMASALGKLKF